MKLNANQNCIFHAVQQAESYQKHHVFVFKSFESEKHAFERRYVCQSFPRDGNSIVNKAYFFEKNKVSKLIEDGLNDSFASEKLVIIDATKNQVLADKALDESFLKLICKEMKVEFSHLPEDQQERSEKIQRVFKSAFPIVDEPNSVFNDLAQVFDEAMTKVAHFLP